MDGSEWNVEGPHGFYPGGPPGLGHSGSFGPYPSCPPFSGPGPSFMGPPCGPFGPPFPQYRNAPETYKKLPTKPKGRPVKCDVCEMTLNSQSVYDIHVNGKTHKRNLAIKNGEIPDYKLLTGPAKKKSKLSIPIVFEAQSQSTRGPVSIEKFFRKCEVCNLFLNSEAQWEVHIAGSKHSKAALLAKTKFNPTNVGAETKPKSPSPTPAPDASNPTPITVTLPRGIVVVDSARQKFVCDYCNNKLLNSLVQIEQHLKSNEHLKRSGARFTGIGKRRRTDSGTSDTRKKDRRETDRYRSEVSDRRRHDDDKGRTSHRRREDRHSRERSDGNGGDGERHGKHRRDSVTSSSRHRRDSDTSSRSCHRKDGDVSSNRHRRESDVSSSRHRRDSDASSNKYRRDDDVSSRRHRRDSDASSNKHRRDSDAVQSRHGHSVGLESRVDKRDKLEEERGHKDKKKRKKEKKSKERRSKDDDGSYDEERKRKQRKLDEKLNENAPNFKVDQENMDDYKDGLNDTRDGFEGNQRSQSSDRQDVEAGDDLNVNVGDESSEERWSDEERFYSQQNSRSREEESCDEMEGLNSKREASRVSEQSCNEEESDRSGSQERNVSEERKFELIEFLDRTYSDRIKPLEKNGRQPSKSAKRRVRERRRMMEESMEDEDRWKSDDGRIKHIKNNFISSGIIKF